MTEKLNRFIWVVFFTIVFFAASFYFLKDEPFTGNAIAAIFGLLIGDAIYSGIFGFDNLKEALKTELLGKMASSHEKLLQAMETGFQEKLESYWTLTLKDILGESSPRMFQGLQKSYLNSLNKKDLIEEFLEGGKVGFCFVKKCDLHEYGTWANIFVERAKESIFVTSIFNIEDFFETDGAEFYKGYFAKFRDKDLPIEKKKRLQIISNIDKFISNRECVEQYKEFNKNNVFRWVKEGKFKLLKMGDYIIIDGIVILRYDPEDEILELLSGEIVETFMKPFEENYYSTLGTWDTLEACYPN